MGGCSRRAPSSRQQWYVWESSASTAAATADTTTSSAHVAPSPASSFASLLHPRGSLRHLSRPKLKDTAATRLTHVVAGSKRRSRWTHEPFDVIKHSVIIPTTTTPAADAAAGAAAGADATVSAASCIIARHGVLPVPCVTSNIPCVICYQPKWCATSYAHACRCR